MGGGSEVAVFEWRHSAGEDHYNTDFWKTWSKEWGKAWIFQRERSEGGYDHYQGYISLKVRRTVSAAKALLSRVSVLPMHFEPVSDNSRKSGTETFYQTKPDTRIEGPWSDKDVEVYIPRQYRGYLERLFPWQQKIWDSADIFEPRKINIIVDETGCQGKSTLASLMELYGRGYDMPPLNDGEKLVQSFADILIAKQDRNPRCVFFDIPRAMKQDKLQGLYAAIEQIKKGKVVDTRYSYKQWWFDSPQVWVFCNTWPEESYMSKDRWNTWTIKDRNLQALRWNDASGSDPIFDLP